MILRAVREWPGLWHARRDPTSEKQNDAAARSGDLHTTVEYANGTTDKLYSCGTSSASGIQ
eukprot:scaffold100294_cov66-Phaeocystis_antarctica.AAC.1